jgi:hypothetical protein
MPERDEARIMLQLAAARSAIDVAMELLGAGSQIEIPPGVHVSETGCEHPKSKRHETFGGHGYCTQCGAKW